MSTETPWAVDRWQGRAIHRCPPLISHVFAKKEHTEQAWNQAVGATDLWNTEGRVLHDKDAKKKKFTQQKLTSLQDVWAQQ